MREHSISIQALQQSWEWAYGIQDAYCFTFGLLDILCVPLHSKYLLFQAIHYKSYKKRLCNLLGISLALPFLPIQLLLCILLFPLAVRVIKQRRPLWAIAQDNDNEGINQLPIDVSNIILRYYNDYVSIIDTKLPFFSTLVQINLISATLDGDCMDVETLMNVFPSLAFIELNCEIRHRTRHSKRPISALELAIIDMDVAMLHIMQKVMTKLPNSHQLKTTAMQVYRQSRHINREFDLAPIINAITQATDQELEAILKHSPESSNPQLRQSLQDFPERYAQHLGTSCCNPLNADALLNKLFHTIIEPSTTDQQKIILAQMVHTVNKKMPAWYAATNHRLRVSTELAFKHARILELFSHSRPIFQKIFPCTDQEVTQPKKLVLPG